MRGDFVQENDTVSISYSFSGENAPVRITVYNKLNEPLFVDWAHSAIIIDDVATVYHDGGGTIQGQARFQRDGNDSSDGSFSGEIALPAGTMFIPPKSKIQQTPLTLANFQFDKIPNENYRKMDVSTSDSSGKSVKVIDYTEEDSPLYFRSYLTISTAPRSNIPPKRMYFERSFYLSKLIKAGSLQPSHFVAFNGQPGDIFYVHKVKGATAGIVAGVIAVSAAGALIGVSVESGVYF